MNTKITKLEEQIAEVEKGLLELKAALRILTEEEEEEIVSAMDVEKEDEVEQPPTNTDTTMIPDALCRIYGRVDNRLIPVPTEYGTLILWKPTFKGIEDIFREIDENEDEGVLQSDPNGIPERLLSYSKVRFEDDKIIMVPSLNGMGTLGWMALWIDTPQNFHFDADGAPVEMDVDYIIPVKMDVLKKNPAPVCMSVDSMKSALLALNTLGFVGFTLPDVFWKITRPGGICRDMTYETGKMYHFPGEVKLHEAGYHYATDFNKLIDWYSPFDGRNEIYYVQVAKAAVRVEEDGVGVTDGILINKLACTIDELGALPF